MNPQNLVILLSAWLAIVVSAILMKVNKVEFPFWEGLNLVIASSTIFLVIEVYKYFKKKA